jgi:hypothetical protein
MLIIEEEVTISDIDEALSHVWKELNTDKYGNRMTPRKKELLQWSIDSLLDARIELLRLASSSDSQ